MPQKTLILVDGFYIAYRSHYAFKDLKTRAGAPSGLLFGYIRTLNSIAQRWPGAEVIVCWDTPNTWRKEVYPEYKGNRVRKKEGSTASQLYAAAQYTKCVGVDQALADGYEADDVIGTLIDPGKLNIIYSRDRDFCQLVRDGLVQVYSPSAGAKISELIFTEEVVKTTFGVYPEKLLLFRALRGDSSDNLPGVKHFPTRKMQELVEKQETVTDICASPDPSVQLTHNQKMALSDFQHQAELNWRLMRILTDAPVRLFAGAYNRAGAVAVLDEFELKSLKPTITLFEDADGGTELFDL